MLLVTIIISVRQGGYKFLHIVNIWHRYRLVPGWLSVVDSLDGRGIPLPRCRPGQRSRLELHGWLLQAEMKFRFYRRGLIVDRRRGRTRHVRWRWRNRGNRVYRRILERVWRVLKLLRRILKLLRRVLKLLWRVLEPLRRILEPLRWGRWIHYVVCQGRGR